MPIRSRWWTCPPRPCDGGWRTATSIRPEKIESSLTHHFRPGNLTALREIALLWAADRVEEALLRYRHDHGIQQPWGTRERVLVALSGGPEGDTLIRRGKRTASRGAGGEFLAVHVERSDGLTSASPELLARQRAMVEELRGSYHAVTGDDIDVYVVTHTEAAHGRLLHRPTRSAGDSD